MSAYVTTPDDYWIAQNAITITRNALGDPNRIQANAASGASILCYIDGIDGLGYDAGHNYRRWPISISPTYFNSNDEKYVYVAIPRSTAVGTQAVVVFPSEKLDIYGKNIPMSGQEEGTQIGSEDYYYIWTQGILSSSGNNGETPRTWQSDIQWGTLRTDQTLQAYKETMWWGQMVNQDGIVQGPLAGAIDYLEFSNGVRIGVDTNINTIKIYKPSDSLSSSSSSGDDDETPANFFATGAVSSLGYGSMGGGGGDVTIGLDWSALTAYDNDPNHVIEVGYLPSIPWSKLTGVPTIPDSTKMGQWDAAYDAMHSHTNKGVLDGITSEKVTAWDNVASIMNSPDSDSVVNKWQEVVAFLNTYTEADTLANLLSNKADKATVTAGTYTKLTVNSQGIVTAGTSLGDGDIPSLSISKVTGLQTALDSKLDIAFFSRLFQAHNGSADVNPNDTQTTIDSIEAMFGFWTDQYLSARGMGANGGAASGLDWSQLTVYDNVSSHVIDLNYLPSIPWSQLTGVPLTFAPSSHQHTHNDISDWSTVMAGYARIQRENDLMHGSNGNKFTFVSGGYGANDVGGKAVYINNSTADGTSGNISQYVFCNGAGSVLATISNGQFSGNAATASKTRVLYDPEDPTKELLFVIPPDLYYFNNLPDEEGSLYYSGTSPEDYYAAVLKWLCRKYGTAYSGRQVMFVMRGRPNSLNFTLLTIYDPSRTNSAGLPEYSLGTAFPLGGSQSLLSFGTFNYVYYYNNGKVGYASTASNASALYGVDASMFLRFERRANYLAARMLSPENAEKAASTYIEWWQDWVSGSGWFNHKAGQYIGLGLQISGDGYVLGNLGVGTSTPAVKLDVAGQLHTSDDITAIHSGTRDGSTVTASVALRFDSNNNPALTLLPSTDQSATARWQVQGDEDWMYLGSYMSSSMKIGATGNTVLANGASLTIGNCVISWDSVNQMLKFTGVSGQTFNGIYSTGAVSSLGAGALGFAGVIEDAMTFNDTVALNDAVALNDNLTINAAKKVKFGTDANAVTIEKYQNGIKAAGVTLSDGNVSADEIEASSDISTSENINVGLTIVMDDQDDGTRQGVLSVEQGHLWFQYDGGTKVRIA